MQADACKHIEVHQSEQKQMPQAVADCTSGHVHWAAATSHCEGHASAAEQTAPCITLSHGNGAMQAMQGAFKCLQAGFVLSQVQGRACMLTDAVAAQNRTRAKAAMQRALTMFAVAVGPV